MNESWRAQWRDLLLFGRAVAIGGLVLLGLLGLFLLGPWLEEQGLPGFPIGLGLILAADGVCVWLVWRTVPSNRRQRAVAAYAASHDGSFRPRFFLPRSIVRLPSFHRAGSSAGARNLVSLHVEGHPVLVFDRWMEDDAPYVPTQWATVAAKEVPLSAPALLVRPRGPVPSDGHGLTAMTMDLEGFNHRFLVLTEDRRFAEAMLDQRVLSWLMTIDDHVQIEIGGPWIAVVHPGQAEPDAMDRLLVTLWAFEAHLPRVVGSMYPRASVPLT
jgi:hypothetical protein